MDRQLIKHVLRRDDFGATVTVAGWVRTRRDSKGGFSFLEINDGSSFSGLQVIAPGDLPYIFERFWRADPARSRTGDRPGVGLGLAISRWIAEAHGGSIEVQSRPGRGTTFTITIPESHPSA